MSPCPSLAERRAIARARALSSVAPDLTLPLRGCRVVVFDTETTGTGPEEARIVEVAAVLVAELGRSEPEVIFRSRVNPGVPIPSGASDVHGITDEDVKDAPSWRMVLVAMTDAIGTTPFVPCAFNAPYDQRVLEAETERHDMRTPPWMAWGHWLDPLVLVRTVDQYEKGKKLRDAGRRRGIEHAEHGAAADAVVTAMLLPKLLAEVAAGVYDRDRLRLKLPSGLHLLAYVRWQRDLALQQEKELAEYLVKSGRRTEFDWTWHRLGRIAIPDVGAPPPAQTGACKSCGAPIIWVVNEKGTRCPVDPTEHEVVLYPTLYAAGIEPSPEAKRRNGYLGTEDAGGVELPADVHPELARARIRESHFATCPESGRWRKHTGASNASP